MFRVFATPVLLLALLVTAPVMARGLDVEIEVPRIDVADYRRPYVAVWIERPDNSVAAHLAVWYDVKMRDGEGTKWLKDIRQWWRRIGREVEVPIDGITAATRQPGRHRLGFTEGGHPLGTLEAGEYRLVVEASREHGGREILRLPFHWPPEKPVSSEVRGEHELGTVGLTLTP